MPTIYYAHLRDLTTPARFTNLSVFDTRYRRFPTPFTPAEVQAILSTAASYLHVPALGDQSCGSGDWQARPIILDWLKGLSEIQAAAPAGDLVVLCGCPQQSDRSHRQLVCRELAAALGLTNGGPLP